MVIHCPRCGKVMEVSSCDKSGFTLTCSREPYAAQGNASSDGQEATGLREVNERLTNKAKALEAKVHALTARVWALREACLLSCAVIKGITDYMPVEDRLCRDLVALSGMITTKLDNNEI